VIINSINAANTETGLEVYAQLDTRDYPKGVKITDAQLAAVNLTGDAFHPEWNYTRVSHFSACGVAAAERCGSR
jgi:hypothetical protein